MKDKKNALTDISLGLLTLSAVVMYRNKGYSLLAGVSLLLTANLLVIIGLSQRLTAFRKLGRDYQELIYSSQYRLGTSLPIIGWQVAIIGILDIDVSYPPRNALLSLFIYLLTVLFFLASWKLVSMADSSKQDGGFIPFNFFGVPRARSLIFALFTIICVILPLFTSSVQLAADNARRPTPFQHPQLCLLIVAITALFSTILIGTRYRNTRLFGIEGRSILCVLLILLIAGFVSEIYILHSLYVYVLTSIAIACSAITMIRFWNVKVL